MGLQTLHDFIKMLIVDKGITDEDKIFRIAYRKAGELGLINGREEARKVMYEIYKTMDQLREAVRRPGELFDKVDLDTVRERLRYQVAT